MVYKTHVVERVIQLGFGAERAEGAACETQMSVGGRYAVES